MAKETIEIVVEYENDCCYVSSVKYPVVGMGNTIEEAMLDFGKALKSTHVLFNSIPIQERSEDLQGALRDMSQIIKEDMENY